MIFWIRTDAFVVTRPRLYAIIHDRHQETALNCKILLPKNSTCEQVLLERENGLNMPFGSVCRRFLAKKHWLYGVIASALRRDRIGFTA